MLVRHALRNAAVSTVSVLGVNIGYLVGGTLVIEQVYALPGVGQLMINSIFQRDFPVVQAVTLVFVDPGRARLPADRRRARAARPAGPVRVMAVAAETVAEATLVEHRHGFRRRWYRTPSFVAGISILGTIILLAMFAPLVTEPRPNAAGPRSTRSPARRRAHWLGTDDLGRDVWSRLVYGARTDLRVAFLAVLFPFVIGTTIGLVAGYYGRLVDTLTSWLVNVVVAFPFYVLIIALVFVLGPGTRNIYIAITIVGWVSYTRIVRGEVLVAKRREYVLGRAGRRALGRAHPRPPPAPERDHAGDRLRDVRHRARHPRDRDARVPRARRAAADAGLGTDDRRRPDVPDHELAALDDPRVSRS